MPRGRNDNNNYRAQGRRGHGRGHHTPSRGRGPGVPDSTAASTTTPTAGVVPPTHPRHRYAHPNADIDVVIQQWTEPSNGYVNRNGIGNLNTGRGPWRGPGTPRSRSGAGTPSRGFDSPRRGNATPIRGTGPGARMRGRGRGRGRGQWTPDGRGDPIISTASRSNRPRFGVGGKAKAAVFLGKDAPLSDLLYAERPLLRPVKFVRATTTPFLFQEPEEVLKPASDVSYVVDTTEASHVPTADRVARLFHANASESDSESDDQDGLEEVDFADLARVRAEVEAIAQEQDTVIQNRREPRQEHDEEVIEEVDFADLAAIRAKVDATAELETSLQDDDLEETFTGVYKRVKDDASTTNVVHDDQLDDVGHTELPFTSPIPDEPLLDITPPNDMSKPPICDESGARTLLDTIPLEEQAPSSTNVRPTKEILPSSTSPDTHPIPSVVPSTDDELHPLFFIDIQPTLPRLRHSASDVVLVDRIGHGESLGDRPDGGEDEDEQIVYVAPHPRSGRVSPIVTAPDVPRVRLPKTSMLARTSIVARVDGIDEGVDQGGGEKESGTGTIPDRDAAHTSAALESAEEDRKVPLTTAEVHTRRRRQRRKEKQARAGFGALGAMVSEARLRDTENEREGLGRRRPSKWAMRRKDDSDLDWGTEDDDNDAGTVKEEIDDVDAVSNGLEEMTLDPDLDLSVDAMQGFLKSMSTEGSRVVTIDDIEDEAQMREDEEEGLGGPEGSSDSELGDGDEEDEEVFDVEEAILIGESDGGEEPSDDSDSDEGLSPGASFQARLRKVRERSRSEHSKTVQEVPDDEDDEDDEDEVSPETRAGDDEAFIAHIQELLDQNSDILSGRDRKQKKALLSRAVAGDDSFLDDPEFTTPVREKKKKDKKGKGKAMTGYFAADLEAQWARDREKKAERKRERQTAKLAALLDPLHAGPSTSGRVSKKAKRAMAKLDPAQALAIAPGALLLGVGNREADLAALERFVRAFVVDVRGRQSVVLPPMDKETRKMVHALAGACGVKSVSRGKGRGRYTTLVRTMRTGVDEVRVRRVMRRYGAEGMGMGGGNGRGGVGRGAPKHREGDEVGKEAPKIGETNVGFKMLASMGWSEGDRIGGTASVGIETPLTAIIKHSKLGLGATR